MLKSGFAFQFHIGSIQGQDAGRGDSRSVSVSIPHWFDSRALSGSTRSRVQHCFNSTLVRFKVLIETAKDTRLTGFNSTLVRFKVRSHGGMYSLGLCFNSTLVRFKEIKDRWTGKVLHSFNSTLVRFKGTSRASNVNGLFLFQFHIGSIQGRCAYGRSHSDGRVSIPHWFDSRKWNAQRDAMNKAGFNSTLVRFKAKTGRRWFCKCKWFQFHIGSIQGQGEIV